VKLLFDENLSHRLVDDLAALCPESTHVRSVGLARANDSTIWRYAQEHGFCIVTQDSDFVERALAQGTPPPVICLRLGNTSTHNLRLSRDSLIVTQMAGGQPIGETQGSPPCVVVRGSPQSHQVCHIQENPA